MKRLVPLMSLVSSTRSQYRAKARFCKYHVQIGLKSEEATYGGFICQKLDSRLGEYFQYGKAISRPECKNTTLRIDACNRSSDRLQPTDPRLRVDRSPTHLRRASDEKNFQSIKGCCTCTGHFGQVSIRANVRHTSRAPAPAVPPAMRNLKAV